MRGWTTSGKETVLFPAQEHAVRVLLGEKEPDEAFMDFWRRQSGGRSVALLTAARYERRQREVWREEFAIRQDMWATRPAPDARGLPEQLTGITYPFPPSGSGEAEQA